MQADIIDRSYPAVVFSLLTVPAAVASPSLHSNYSEYHLHTGRFSQESKVFLKVAAAAAVKGSPQPKVQSG